MNRRTVWRCRWMCVALLCAPRNVAAQSQGVSVRAELRVSAAAAATAPATKTGLPPAVLWLKPLRGDASWPASTAGGYTLLQKDKMFSPHLLVVPVGSVVRFPNRDPFFHNVFSLFDGKRFDLGLYEAGKTREVVFSKEGVSYIFCNIHSDMSAVVIALTTPLYSIADGNGAFLLRHVAMGDYEVHLWVEGQSPAALQRWVRTVHIAQEDQTLGPFVVGTAADKVPHANKFGQPYQPEADREY